MTDTHFFLLVAETNKLAHAGQNCLVQFKYFFNTLVRQSSISLSFPSTKSKREEIVNSSYLGSSTEKFWVFVTNVSTKLKVRGFKPIKCLTWYKRPCNSQTLLAEARAKRKQVFQATCLSEDSIKGSCGGQRRLLRTRGRFHSSCLISLGRQFFMKLLNIVLITASNEIRACQGKHIALYCRYQQHQLYTDIEMEFLF